MKSTKQPTNQLLSFSPNEPNWMFRLCWAWGAGASGLVTAKTLREAGHEAGRDEIENYQDLAPDLVVLPQFTFLSPNSPGYISSEGEFCRFSSFGDRQTGLL